MGSEAIAAKTIDAKAKQTRAQVAKRFQKRSPTRKDSLGRAAKTTEDAAIATTAQASSISARTTRQAKSG